MPPVLLSWVATSHNYNGRYYFHNLYIKVPGGDSDHHLPPPYEEWIQDWMKHFLDPANKLRVPAAASRITWHIMLAEYPNRPLTDFFISGIRGGFRVSFAPCGTRIKSVKRNLHCAVEHPEVAEHTGVAESNLTEEVELECITGPFSCSSVPHEQVRGKNHQPNKWRLIVDLSHPKGHSVNSGISKQLVP